MRGSASSTSRPAISRSRAKTSARGSSSTASSTISRRSSASSSRRGTACARDRTARSRCICTRISAPQCLHRLRGEFAFVLWDETQPHACSPRAIASASSRCSTRVHDDTLYLASEVKALFAAGVPARWDAESVFHSVEFGGHQMRTLYDGVFQVPPGHYLIATDGTSSCIATGISTTPRRGRPTRAAVGRRVRRGVPRRRWTRRCGCDCAPTCRSAAI